MWMQEDRKIIFVTHSLGGLVTQDCLWRSRNHAEKHLRQVSSCAIGISFLGTPHHGADLAAWAKFGTTMARMVKHANSDIVSVLKPGSEMLATIQDGFHSLLRIRRDEGSEIAITCFFEELPLPVIGKVRLTFLVVMSNCANHPQVVETHSAIIPGYAYNGIRANHMASESFRPVYTQADSPGYD